MLELVSMGLENKEIGHRLGISEQAVKEHVSNLLRLLSAPNRAALADAAATMRVVGNLDVPTEWLGLVFLHAPMKAALHEGPEHRFIAANDAYRAGAGTDTLIGRTFREVFPVDDDSGVMRLLDQAYRTGEPVRSPDMHAQWHKGAGGAIEDGYITMLIQPMRRADGSIGGVAQFSIDVTKEVEARSVADRLAEEESAILDQLPCGVIVVDRDGYVIKMNDWGKRLVPWDGAQRTKPVELLEVRDPATGGDLSEADRPLVRALKGERFAERDVLGVVVQSGRRIPLRISAAPLFDSGGKVRGAIAIFSSSSGD